MTPKIIIFLVMLTCLFSCDSDLQNHRIKKVAIDPSSAAITFPLRFNRRIDLNAVIKLLDDSSALEAKYIGIAGSNSLMYSQYECIKLNAPDSLLLALSYHKNPKLRVYAMWALTDRNKALAIAQLPRFSRDTTTVYFRSGCMTTNDVVNRLSVSQFERTEVQITKTDKMGRVTYEVYTK